MTVDRFHHLYQGWHFTIIRLKIEESKLSFKYVNAENPKYFGCWPKWTPHLRPIAKDGECYMILQQGDPKEIGKYKIHGAAKLDISLSEAKTLNFLTKDIMETCAMRRIILPEDPYFLGILTRYMPMSILPWPMDAFHKLMESSRETLRRWHEETGDWRYDRLRMARDELDVT